MTQKLQEVRLERGALVLPGRRVETLEGYQAIETGKYTPKERERKKVLRIEHQLWREGYYEHRGGDVYFLTKAGEREKERRMKSEWAPTQYLQIRYPKSGDYRELQSNIRNAIPNGLKDSLDVVIHINNGNQGDGIELLARENVKFGI